MRGKDLLECIEQIDDALVEEAMEPAAFSHSGRHRFQGSSAAKWGMAAACVVVLGISAAAFWAYDNARNVQPDCTDGAARYPAELYATADNSDTDTGNLSDSSLARGGAADSGDDVVHDEAAIDRESEKIHDGGTTGSSSAKTDGIALDNREDTASQSSAADDLSDKESANVQKAEKVVAESEKSQCTIISDYYGEKNSSVSDHAFPEKGKIICSDYLQETVEHYAQLENAIDNTAGVIYAYNIVIDVYGDIIIEGSQEVRYERLNLEDTTARNEMISQEYMRLVELGYAVQLAEDLQLTGTFTEEELDNFQVSPEYGYVFRFADEY